ncbi:hypothetical protein [Streptomyces sp. NPDC059378]|uniref:hypothetical protein n=1 Tax=Streptomyces sp. NPDC059378 TaxID=3346815 RepID=UPI00368AC759
MVQVIEPPVVSSGYVVRRCLDGTVRWHSGLEIDGTPTPALFVAVALRGDLLIGMVDGRIPECSVRRVRAVRSGE